MKKHTLLFVGMILTGMTFFSSCSKDESTPDQPPSLTLQVGTGYTSQNATVTVNTDLKFGVRAMANSTSNARLTELTMTRTMSGHTNTYDTILPNLTNLNLDLLTKANSVVGTETFIFTVKDKDGQSATITLLITTTAASGPINEFSMKIMGAQKSTTGSSFASINGTVYNLADAKANSSKIDWVYYYGATDFATLASPADDHAQSVYTGVNGITGWAVKNDTKFKLITDAVDFSAITNDQIIMEQTASGVDQTRIPSLVPGKLLSFITASGKKGIIKVETIATGDDGTITISVKVQQ